MIISASYKTDIPTFYGEWFSNRLNAGYCKMVNPYNRRAIHVDLRRGVGGFVFWTKNVAPFLRVLSNVREKGFPFVVQHTINGYPRQLEYAVVDADRSVSNLRRISEEYGKRVPVWRYDTIVMSSLTPVEFHLRNFERIAKQLEGAVDEVVISFAQLYRKTLLNMNAAAKTSDFSWNDPAPEEKRDLTVKLVQIADAHSMQLSICSQRSFLVPGATDARCVDAQRLSDVAGVAVAAALKGNRKECGCFASRDIGEYDTCPHGCIYCYAVQNRQLAQERFRKHDPNSEYLFAPDYVAGDEPRGVQLPLFAASAVDGNTSSP